MIATLIEHHQAVGDLEYELHVVSHYHDGDVASDVIVYHTHKLRGLSLGEPVARLVQQKQLGIGGQAELDLEATLVAVGQTTDRVVPPLPQAGLAEHLCGRISFTAEYRLTERTRP